MLPQHERLKRKIDFDRLRQEGKRHNRRSLSLVVLRNNEPDRKAGFIVTKRLSKKAVVRNRIKRQMRAAYLLHRPHLKQGYLFLFIARHAAMDGSFIHLESQMKALLNEVEAIFPACIES